MSLIAEPIASVQPYHHPRKNEKVDLSEVAELLHKLVTESLCEKVFLENRTVERQREWSFFALSRFWIAVIIRAPEALSHALAEVQEGKARIWPHVEATSEAFFQKAQDFSWKFFAALFTKLMPRFIKQAPDIYAKEMEELRKHFPEIWIMDGSQLAEAAHRLKLLRKIVGAVLPGRVFAFYDLFRGICRHLQFEPNAARNENLLATESLQVVPEGTLVVGDRLFGVIKHFRTLAERRLWGVFRRNGTVNIKEREVLSRKQGGGRSYLEDALVDVGSGDDKITLRLIRYSDGKRKIEVLTNVLDPKKLQAATVIRLYGLRWGIERMFFDLKEVLNLNRFYAGNLNAVAAQFYAGVIVYNAFRVVQARIAQRHGIRPEELSPARLYPKLAAVCSAIAECELMWDRTVRANRGVDLNKPGYKDMGFTVLLESILVEKKARPRTKGTPNPRSKWLTWDKIPGGAKMLQKLS